MVKEYTNEMVDRLMSILVPSFCYREKDVTIKTQRIGYISLDGDTYLLWYGFDDGLQFMIEDSDFSINTEKLVEDEIIEKFNGLIIVAMKEFGLSLFECNIYSQRPTISFCYPHNDKEIQSNN